MIHSNHKLIYFWLMRYPMNINGWFYRRFRCPARNLKVHLGPGQTSYLNGWVNVDANFITAKIDLWANFMDTLPFRDNSAQVIYAHHVIEHLPDENLQHTFQEMYRVLAPSGGIRIAAPHLGNACRKYAEGDKAWFNSDFPAKRESIGGRFTNLIFCRGEHLTGLDESYLTELAAGAGFTDIAFQTPIKETQLADVGIDEQVLSKEWESDFSCPHTIVLEARKPS